MGVYLGPKEPSIDLSLNANNSVTISLKNIPASEYQIKVDGFTGIITTSISGNSAVGILTVSPGLTRNITVDAYQGNSLSFTVSKYVKIFDYVGTSSTVGWGQTWTVPPGVRYLFADVQGAQGGSSGGFGGRQKAYISVSSGQTLYFYCGGAGQNSISVGCTSVDPGFRIGGFNGGGNGGGKSDAYTCSGGQTSYSRGASGGGASDIRTNPNDLTTRIIVAGGGGGRYGSFGGSGGNDNGDDGGYSVGGSWPITLRGSGASQTSAGAGGTGGSHNGNNGLLGIGGTGARFVQFGDNGGAPGGGGGGYFGGGGGGAGSNFGAGGGGGGGSGFIDPIMRPLLFSNSLGSLTTGYRSGDGRILISWTSPLSYSDIVTSGLVLNLDAQNYYSYPGSGTTWTDLSGNGYTASMRNLTSSNWVLVDGQRAFETNDTGNQGFTVSNFVRPGTNRTYSIWLKSKSFSIGWQTWFDDGGERILFGTDTNTVSIYPDITLTANLQINTWYNLVYTLSGTSAIGYVNGSSIGSGTYSSTLTSGTGDLWILGNNSTEVTSCYCSYASIYNRALTEAEVQQNFNALRGRFGI